MKLTKKQIKEVAEMWAAGLLLQANADAFSQAWDISVNDQEKVLDQVDTIARKLMKGRKQAYTLNAVIENAIKPIDVIISDSRDQPL